MHKFTFGKSVANLVDLILEIIRAVQKCANIVDLVHLLSFDTERGSNMAASQQGEASNVLRYASECAQ